MVSRRRLITGGVTVGTTAWIAPAVVSFGSVASAQASGMHEVPAVSNGALLIPNPPIMAEGTPPLDSNTNTYVWLEGGPVTLTSDLTVNRTTAGNFNGNSDQQNTIATGTTVCAYYVHGDRLDDGGRLTGTLTFSTVQILGLIYKNPEYAASSFLQAPGTTYVNGPMEGGDNMSLDLTVGANSVSWDMRFGPALDGMRVITTCL